MPNALLILLALTAIIVVIGIVARTRGRTASPPQSDGYLDRFTAAPALLTANERDFFLATQPLLEPRYRVFAKVRLADLVEIYLFCPDRGIVYLALMQGATSIQEEFKSRAGAVMRDRAAIMRSRVPEAAARFDLHRIDLNSDLRLPKGYESGHAISLFVLNDHLRFHLS